MTHTPDEIKKGLEYLNITDIAEKLKRFEQGVPYMYAEEITADVLAYIQQLEADNAQKSRCIENLTDKLNVTNDALPRWISVEERLPDVREDVAIIIRHGEYEYLRVGWIRKTGEWFQAGLGVVEGKVTHWMPLPEPPKEEERS